MSRIGSNRKPTLHWGEVSGLRSGDAMLRGLSWVSTQRASSSAMRLAGQPGAVTELAVLPNDGGLCRSQSDGARKPLPAEPRSSSSLVGFQRSDTIGLVFEPTSL